MTIKFVSAFIDLEEENRSYKPPHYCFQQFYYIAVLDLPMTLFLSRSMKILYNQYFGKLQLKNLKLIEIDLQELETYKMIQSIECDLPSKRNMEKDTKNFLIVQNAKTEFMKMAIQADGEITGTHYAWIDFNLFHIIQSHKSIQKLLQRMAEASFNESCLYIPGCWDLGREKELLLNKINWRFCGGFFLGDKDSLLNFYEVTQQSLFLLIRVHKILAWEVNIWHYCELYSGLNINWYSADHNDSILNVPMILAKPRILALILMSDTDEIYCKFQKEWRKNMNHPYVDCFFYKAHPNLRGTSYLSDDCTLLVKENDIPSRVWEKTLLAFQHFCPILDEYDFVYRPNASSFIFWPNLIQWASMLPKKQCVSATIGYYPPDHTYPSGAGFFLSTDLLPRIVGDKDLIRTIEDDITVGVFAKKNNIQIIAAPRIDILSVADRSKINAEDPVQFHYRIKSFNREDDIQTYKILLKAYNIT